MKLAFCIRGHVRDGLTDSSLREYIYSLRQEHYIDLFLHTWNESEAKSSYRDLDRNSVIKVDETILYHYFKDLNRKIKNIIVDDDSKINLIGNLQGTVCKSSCPLISWKRMWYGKHKVVQSVDNYKDYDILISTRYDLFTNVMCKMPPVKFLRINYGKKLINFKYPQFAPSIIGVDNYYSGNPENIIKLTSYFYNDLDSIISKYPDTDYQEELVYKFATDNNLI